MKKILLYIFLFITMFSCGSKTNEKVVYHNAVSEGISFDPQLLTDANTLSIHGLLSEGLTYTMPDGKVVPGLAKSWDISEDGLTWTFHLREGLKYSDGRDLKAQDFSYAWFRALDPNVGSEYAYMLFVIENAREYTLGEAKKENVGIKVLDDHTLQVKLVNRTPYFDSLVSFITFMPANQEFVEQMGESYGLEADTILYSGPYKVQSWAHNQEMVIVKNEHYYDQSVAKVDKFVVKYISDPNASLNAYKNGELDFVEIYADQIKEFANSNELEKHGIARTDYLSFNLTKDLFKNKNIREAFSLAIDKDQMIETVFENTKQAAYTFTPKNVGMLGYKEDFATELGDVFEKFNPEKARAILAKGLQELGLSELPEVTLLADERGSNKKLVENLQEQIRVNLGVKVKVEVVTFKERLNRTNTSQFDIVIAGWGADYQDPMTFLDLLTSLSGNNTSKYASKEYDALIEKAASSKTNEERVKAFQDAEKLLAKDLPIFPLYQETQIYLVSENITGLGFGAVAMKTHLRFIDKK